ncbi:DUF3347 domain-containing protein [Fibrella aquatilis]|uniref:DUF3347 domain-containing protein n=1 Tax=Fibrella aquatilis TaxID=2817059 RepID=A0A939K0Z5_9BACT|nr:DUF3347 domain-containing protein [Fibrella aquatilis]MBO0932516.1 DUF3347 domain-containing protein [Fibrella aquatilis]
MAYFQLKAALVASDGGRAKARAATLLNVLDQLDRRRLSATDQQRLLAIDTAAFSICKSSNVTGQRRFFGDLSLAMIALVRSTRPATVYVQFSSSAFPHGAYWLSGTKQIENPYAEHRQRRQGRVINVIKGVVN